MLRTIYLNKLFYKIVLLLL